MNGSVKKCDVVLVLITDRQTESNEEYFYSSESISMDLLGDLLLLSYSIGFKA